MFPTLRRDRRIVNPGCFDKILRSKITQQSNGTLYKGIIKWTVMILVEPLLFMDNVLMGNQNRLFYSYSSYLKERYGNSAYRVAVDAQFSCPNRSSDRSGGCTYCDELGSMAVYHRGLEADLAYEGSLISAEVLQNPDRIENLSGNPEGRKVRLKEQIEQGIRFLKRRYNAEYLLLYFQAFSSTFAAVTELQDIYDYSLSLAPFREIIVSTRPDCISDANAELLSSYITRGLDVWVELGLQSSHDKTLNRINRGHSREDFYNAYMLLKKKGIKISVHLIFGLPGEDRKEIMESVDFIARLKPEGVKIHNLHIPIGTDLFNEYLFGEITVPCGNRHLEYTIEAIERMPVNTIIHRLTCDTPAHRLAAPRSFFKKGSFFSLLNKEMNLRGSRQGRLFSD